MKNTSRQAGPIGTTTRPVDGPATPPYYEWGETLDDEIDKRERRVRSEEAA